MPKRKKVADPIEKEDGASTEQSRMKHIEMLNSSFFRWIQDQHTNHRSEFWRNGLEEYLQYGRTIQAKFPVAVDTAAEAPSTSDAAGAARSDKPQKPAAFPGLSPLPSLPTSQPASSSWLPQSQPVEGAVPSTTAIGTGEAPKPLFGFSAPVQPAAFSLGGKSTVAGSTAPKPSNSFSFGPPAASTPPLSAAAEDRQEAPSLSNHHVLPISTEGAGNSKQPPTSTSTAAAVSQPAEPVGGLAAASSTSAPLPSLPVSGSPSTSAWKSLPVAALKAPDVSPSISGLPSAASAEGISPALGASQLPSADTAAAFSFGSGSTPAFGGTSQAVSAAASSPFPFALGSGQTPATTPPAPGASHLPSSSSSQPPASTSQPFSFGAVGTQQTVGTAAASSSEPPALFSFNSTPTAASVSNAASSPASGQPAFGSGTFAFGSSQPAFGSSQFAFGSSSPASGASLPSFGSSQPAFGSPLPAANASQSGPSATAPLFSFGASQPAPSGLSPSAPSPATGGAMAFSWGPPKSSPISGETGSAVANGNGPAPGLFGASAAPFSFGGFGGASGQNGAVPAFGAIAAQGNGVQEEDDEPAEPEEAVVYEKAEGVLLSLEVKWRHQLDGKWAKTRQGKVLVCQPSGTAKPYLQFQTSGQVVATAHVQTPLKQQKQPSQLLGALSVSIRHVDKSGVESYDEPKVWSTLIYCSSADAAKELAHKLPSPTSA